MIIATPVLGLLILFGAAVSTEAAALHSREHAQISDRLLVPDSASAVKHAHDIFNQLNSAGRQWGSSLNHNGLGFFPAIIPAGTLIYHGDHTSQPPTRVEWLSFEVEHAEAFASSHREFPPRPETAPMRPIIHVQAASQRPLRSNAVSEHHTAHDHAARRGRSVGAQGVPECPPDGCRNLRGYLQTYQAARDLRVLYLDGMAAAKTAMGTLDSQDLVLCEGRIGNITDDFDLGEERRANMLCDMLGNWGYDGAVRMEVGFELLYCDFGRGLDFLSARRTFFPQGKLSDERHQLFRLARAAAERYDGIGDGRLRIDFSSIVSGWLFPINITNTDPGRPDLPRFGSVVQIDLKAVKNHVARACTSPRRFTVDWQAVTDSIVKRFSRRFVLMASPDCSIYDFIEEIESATLTYVDAPRLSGDTSSIPSTDGESNGPPAQSTTEEVSRCTKHFLLPALKSKNKWKLEDELLYTAIETVSHDICMVLFSIRAGLLDASSDPESEGYRVSTSSPDERLGNAVEEGRVTIQQLIQKLGWTEFKKVSPCRADEVMFTAMWPMGNDEDHFHPGCVRENEFDSSRLDYWDLPAD
ncbi:hypothetical protein NQ176_g5711 [Zarea fungicola]|uniref:Uncharacterized protein n=1 Tax=Zarea fungicola TaxID=93591 RepID=A0ACC1N758_9HYPO|nr:hypothetical protein NQ176_g5711 [Lecanicillium fungicola]